LIYRSFVQAYKKTLEVHEALAQNRTRFASRLYEMSDELVNLGKEGERLRKLVSVILILSCEDPYQRMFDQ
jgi:hypothetical protein